MNSLDALVTLLLVVTISCFGAAIGCVLADWRRYLRWFRKHLRWQWMTETWGRWAP